MTAGFDVMKMRRPGVFALCMDDRCGRVKIYKVYMDIVESSEFLYFG